MSTTITARRKTEITIGDGVETHGDFTVSGSLTARDALSNALDALPSGDITVTINDTGTSTTFEWRSGPAGGGTVPVATGTGGSTTERAAAFADEFNTNPVSNVTTFFTVSSSANVVTFRPRYAYSMMRLISMRRVSGTSATMANSDGTAITSLTAYAQAPIGGAIRLGRGFYDSKTGDPAILTVDKANVTIEADRGVTWVASQNGFLEIFGGGFEMAGLDVVWEDDDDRNNKWLIRLEASEVNFRRCSFSIDSIGSQGGGQVCYGIIGTQLAAILTPGELLSFDYQRHTYEECNFYLGNRVYGLFETGVFEINVRGCKFTSLFNRATPAGQGSDLSRESPYYAAIFADCDHINFTDNDVVNMGGHSDADNTDAYVKFVRVSGQFNQVTEGGHVLVQGGRFHGLVNNNAADLLFVRCWFARVEGTEFHRKIINTSHSPAHNYWQVGCIHNQDSLMCQVDNCEFFNLGSDGSNTVNYPAIGVLSLNDFLGHASGDRSKTMQVTNCLMDNKQLPTNQFTTSSTNCHSFVQYFGTENGHRFNVLDVTDNTLVGGRSAIARFTVVANLVAGDGFEIVIPNLQFGSSPSGTKTITLRVGTEVSAAAAGNFHNQAQEFATACKANADFDTHFTAEVAEDVYQSNSLTDYATVLIRAREMGSRAHGCTIKHLTPVGGRSTLTTGGAEGSPTTVNPAATGNFEDGVGVSNGQVAIWLNQETNDHTTLPAGVNIGTHAPRHATIKGNTFIGWWFNVVGDIDASGPPTHTGVEEINTWATDNVTSKVFV